jgi:hypothetical protein
MLLKRIYASWPAEDSNSAEIIKELGALPDKWLKDRKNQSERCAFMPPVITNYAFDENKNLIQSVKIASFGVFEYLFRFFRVVQKRCWCGYVKIWVFRRKRRRILDR